jgi:hypothetical protein
VTAKVQSRWALGGLFALSIALAACTQAGTDTTNGPKPPTSIGPSSSPTPTAPAEVNAADYLTDGGPGGGSGLGEAVYSFYTDDSKTVRCDLSTSSVPPDLASCEIVKGNESLVTYAMPTEPAAACDLANAKNYRGDGYQVSLGVLKYLGQDAGFWGCREVETDTPDVLTASKVMPNGSSIVAGSIVCAVADGDVSCGYISPGNDASFTFGLSVASFTQ